MSQLRVTSRNLRNCGHLVHSGPSVLYTEGGTVRTQVAYPHLGGETKSHLLNFQKQQLIPELREHSMVSAALVEADDGHWNVTNDPVYPTCLEVFRRRYESSQDPQANKFAEGSGTGGGSPTGVTTPLSTTSSQPLLTPALGAHEIGKLFVRPWTRCMLSASRSCKKWVSYGMWIEH